MKLLGTPLALVDAAHLDRLVSDSVLENQQIDFKRTLYKFPVSPNQKSTDELKSALCKDVTSLANKRGGVIACGIAANQGVASAIVGVSQGDIDNEKLWIEIVLAQHVDPPIAGIVMETVTVPNGLVLLIGVPRSLSRPHGFTTGAGTSLQFWTRHNAGNRPMESSEIRQSYLEFDAWEQAALSFRRERIRRLKEGEGLPPLSEDRGTVVIHVLPLGGARDRIDLPAIDPNWAARLYPGARGGGITHVARPNSDGWMVSVVSNAERRHAQIFRIDGGFEVRFELSEQFRFPGNEAIAVNGGLLELTIAQWIKRAFGWFNVGEIEGPYVTSIVLLNVKDLSLHAAQTGSQLYANYAIDRRNLDISDQVLDTIPADTAIALRPTFDALWQAASWDRSPCFRDDGTVVYADTLSKVTWESGL